MYQPTHSNYQPAGRTVSSTRSILSANNPTILLKSRYIDQTSSPLTFHVFVTWLAALRPMGAAACGASGQPAIEIMQTEWQPMGRRDAVFWTILFSIGSGHRQCEYHRQENIFFYLFKKLFSPIFWNTTREWLLICVLNFQRINHYTCCACI
jgi:hypothetical protein